MIKRKRKKGIPDQKRQGDYFFQKVDTIRGVKQEKPRDRFVIGEGEVTGHAHAIYELETADIYLEGTRRYLQSCLNLPAATAKVKHEEHDTVDLEPGVWEIIQQRTWSCWNKAARPVED